MLGALRLLPQARGSRPPPSRRRARRPARARRASGTKLIQSQVGVGGIAQTGRGEAVQARHADPAGPPAGACPARPGRHGAAVGADRRQRCDGQRRGEALVAGEQLVAAVAAQRDRDVLRVSSASRNVGIALESPNGWSWCQTSRSTSSTASGSTTNSVWSVPKRSATSAGVAAARRTPSSSSKPIVNVCTGRSSSSAISPTTALESIPPLRNAPSGTSAISRRSHGRRSGSARTSRRGFVERQVEPRRSRPRPGTRGSQ